MKVPVRTVTDVAIAILDIYICTRTLQPCTSCQYARLYHTVYPCGIGARSRHWGARSQSHRLDHLQIPRYQQDHRELNARLSG